MKNNGKKNSEIHWTSGFCPVFKKNFPVKINYIKSPALESGESTYFKMLTFDCAAWGHDEPHCTLNNKMDCPVYTAAPSSLRESEL